MLKSLKILFIANTVFNGLGALILFFFPSFLDSLTGLSQQANFLWQLLGACSLALAVLSAFATKMTEEIALKGAVATFIIFNLLSAILSLSLMKVELLGNTAIHLVLTLSFLWLARLQFKKK